MIEQNPSQSFVRPVDAIIAYTKMLDPHDDPAQLSQFFRNSGRPFPVIDQDQNVLDRSVQHLTPVFCVLTSE
jgi:hypothetical protein